MDPHHRHDLTDEQWARLEPLLPQPHRTGRPAHDHRTMLNGILWIVRSGAPWRDLPTDYGPWATVYSRFRRWRKAGVWEHILRQLQAEAAHAGTLDDTLAFIDGTNIRAHHHAAGPKKGAPKGNVG